MRRAHILAAAALLTAVLIAVGASSAPAPEARIGTVDVFAIVDDMLQRDPYAADREALREELTNELQKIVNDATEIQTQLQILAPSDPQYEDLALELQARQQAYDAGDARAARELDRQRAHHVSHLFGRMIDATRNVAQREGLTRIIANRAMDRSIQPVNLNAAIQEVLARPVLYDPEATDITNLVLAELRKR